MTIDDGKDAGNAPPVIWPARYELLDGLRGIAALVVVLNHVGALSAEAGHLAVMLFFVISGYCISASADSCRRGGRGFGEFMSRRIRRIYPPYLFAILFFTASRVVKTALGGPNALRRPILDWVQNVTLTQWVSDLVHPVGEAVQNPKLFVAAFWSLNYEEQFYLVMALALVLAISRGVSLLVPVVCLAILGLAWNWVLPGGWMCGLFIEYWVHFALGACLFFALTQFANTWRRYVFLGTVSLLGLVSAGRIMLLQTGAATYVLRAMTEFAFLSVVTLALFFARPMSAALCRSVFWRPFAALGAISYSLYLVHQFNLTLVAVVAQHILPLRAPQVMMFGTEIVLFIALATVFWWFCERPFLRLRSPPNPLTPTPVLEPRSA
jgi:peptidoglycan/LPS O-acetylase OafA/YrhL